jgi:hypothetical protein
MVESSTNIDVCSNIILLNTTNKTVIISNEYLLLLFNHSTFFSPGATKPIVGVYFTALYHALASSRTRLLDHTQQCNTVGRTPLNE